VIVSHKVASVRRADRIIVLESGTIVEQGTHAELLARGGRYAEIHRQQTSALAVASL
jgi:ABC-type multidrug transport system fused ATPase/permease subunit